MNRGPADAGGILGHDPMCHDVAAVFESICSVRVKEGIREEAQVGRNHKASCARNLRGAADRRVRLISFLRPHVFGFDAEPDEGCYLALQEGDGGNDP